MVYNDVTVAEVIVANIVRAPIVLASLLLYNKLVDKFMTLHSERDLFKSGHLQFVHSLKEGLVIVHDHQKDIKLINVAARQMLQLPFADDCTNDTRCFEQF